MRKLDDGASRRPADACVVLRRIDIRVGMQIKLEGCVGILRNVNGTGERVWVLPGSKRW